MDTLTLALFIELLLVVGAVGPMHYGANMVRTGHFQQALPILRAYYAASRLLPRWRGPMAGFLCACYVGMGEFALAQPYAEEAVRENSKYNYPQHLASARAHLGIILIHQGDFDQAAPLIDQTLKADIPPRLRPTVELFAANGYINLDRQDKAEKLILDVMANAKPGSDIHIVALANLSQCRLLQGRAEDALDIARQAAQPKAPNANIRFAVLRGLLVCLTEVGLLGEAQTVATQIAPDLNKMDAFRQGAALRALAELALKQGDLDRARDLAQRSATLGINPNAHANTLLIQAQVFAARHNTHRALTLCHDILETRSVRYYKQRAQELIDRLEAPNTFDNAALAADKADELVDRLGSPDTLANSPAQKYVTTEEGEEEEKATAWTANPEQP